MLDRAQGVEAGKLDPVVLTQGSKVPQGSAHCGISQGHRINGYP